MIRTRDVVCDLCGSNNRKFLFNARDRLYGFEGTFSYVRCTECGLVYMNPQISLGDIGKFYPDDYGPHQVESEKKRSHKRPLITKFKKNPFAACVFCKLTRESQLLDVGCGSGKFLNEIRIATGCQVYGVDTSKVAARTAKENYSLEIFTGMLTEVPFPDNHFDVITARSYLEHVNNPSEVMLKLFRLLKQGGDLVIITPNFDSLNSKMFKDKWYALDCPRHLYIYSAKTITKLLEKSGLSVQKIKYDKSSKGFLGSLQYYFHGDNYNPEHRNRIRRSPLLKKVVSPWTRGAALIKQSDIMIVHAKKAS